MFEIVQSFLRSINEKTHISQLLGKNNCLKIGLVSWDESFILVITEGKLDLLENTKGIKADYEIEGEIEAIRELLVGKEKLRCLAQNGRLKISANFRTTLLLESMFYLTKFQNDLEKINN